VFAKTGPGFLDNEWFKGAAFNYAENVLRIRDDREALLCLDEEGNFEKVTFREMFEEVKLYAAAFRKHGLQKGKTVALVLITNSMEKNNKKRFLELSHSLGKTLTFIDIAKSILKEAIYAMLAATSIGAIWGGPQPFLGARAASYIVTRLEAKFLIAVDSFVDYGEEHSIMDNLSFIAENAPTLEKIIIVPTKEETLSKDISHIPNSCFLEPFLESGITPNGEIPDIVFEQLPFDHPVSVAFTSGTTGMPKGAVHSAGSLLGPLVHFTLHLNLKSGDVVHNICPNYHVTCLSLGMKLFLQNENVYYLKDGSNLWDVISKYKIAYSLLLTSMVDKLEKMKAYPDPSNRNFEHLKILTIGGATEGLGHFTGCDYNLPVYAPEVQVPSLGMKVQCFDSKGYPVVGHEGEMVITVPIPTLPIYLWKDKNNKILKKIYLTKYPGFWCQHDVCYVNPHTKGMMLKGRSDDVFIQKGERFGAADIYFAIHDIEEIQDYICVGQKKWNGDSRAVLFVRMRNGYVFTPEFKNKISNKIKSELGKIVSQN
ncbi:acetoacetyl-CoA synthetase, partial [Trichonephila inaurata madagascariensis]